MERTRGWMLSVLLVGAGCAEELRCYEGAVEVNGVCECAEGTAFVRARSACEPIDGGVRGAADAAGADPGQGEAGERDASAAPATGGMRDVPAPGRAPQPAAPAPGAACSDAWTRCGDVCVDPGTDERHCGGCNRACAAGTTCQAGVCVAEVGCSDGTREAFVDRARFPEIAGCAATWPKRSLRAPREGVPCGNDRAGCSAPADACARGWHVCGDAPDGPADVTTRIAQADCVAQPGRFAIALGDHSCADCGARSTGAACCGAACLLQGGGCLWPGATPWFGQLGESKNLCREIENPLVRADVGVTCCRDR